MFKTLLAAVAVLNLAVTQAFHPLHDVQGKLVMSSELIKKNPVNYRPSILDVLIDPPQIGVVDQFYFAPNANEVYGLIQGVKNEIVYTPEVYDCDDYSYWFKGELQKQWRKAGHIAPLPIIQIFGVIRIHATGELVGHAFNGIITSDGTIVWIEPQGPMVMNAGKFTILKIYAFWV
ncbi:MAG: hypothetical protein AB7V39_00580 [Nitrospiraceae bacterium]